MKIGGYWGLIPKNIFFFQLSEERCMWSPCLFNYFLPFAMEFAMSLWKLDFFFQLWILLCIWIFKCCCPWLTHTHQCSASGYESSSTYAKAKNASREIGKKNPKASCFPQDCWQIFCLFIWYVYADVAVFNFIMHFHRYYSVGWENLFMLPATLWEMQM